MAATLTIGSLAEQTGCNVPTIRHYEAIGLLPRASRRPSGHRIYTEVDLDRPTFIRNCRSLGLPITQVRELLLLADHPEQDCTAAAKLAEAQLSIVRSKIAELRSLERQFVRLIDSTSGCAGGPAGDCVMLKELAARARPMYRHAAGKSRQAPRR